MMETKKQLSPLHCIFFIYQSFAHTAAGGEVTKEEQQVINNCMYRWTGSDEQKTQMIIRESVDWAKENIKTIQDQVETMMSMINFLKQQSDFNILKREFFLMDIRNIARADNQFSESEKKWHDMLAKALGLEIRISPESHEAIKKSIDRVKKRKIGFRR